jgi:acetoacetyl-CoA reductase
MTQRVALVTGAMGGLGTAICQELAKAGHKVVAPITRSSTTRTSG